MVDDDDEWGDDEEEDVEEEECLRGRGGIGRVICELADEIIYFRCTSKVDNCKIY